MSKQPELSPSDPALSADFIDQLREREHRDLMRHKIAAEAGDTKSLIGTINDGSTMLLFRFSQLIVSLSTVQSVEEVRECAAQFLPTATKFLDDVENGAVELPYQLKGEAAVMDEIGTRATAVTGVFKNSQKG